MQNILRVGKGRDINPINTHYIPSRMHAASSGRQLLSAETTSLLNLLTACLLLFIVWTVLAPILDGTVSIVRNDDRHRFLAGGSYGNRRFDEDNHYNYRTSGGGGYYEAATSASSEQYYGTNFEEHGPGVGHYSSSSSPDDESGLPVSQIEGYSTTGWEYAARGFEDGLTSLFNRAVNRYRARLHCRSRVARMLRARSGRSGRQQEEQSSHNLGTAIIHVPLKRASRAGHVHGFAFHRKKNLSLLLFTINFPEECI